MKLNIQHLSRLLSSANLDPEDKARVEKISRTLLTQIDSLTAIANTFSQFATMPVEQFAPFSLNTLVQEVGALFAEEEGVELLLSLPEHELIINGDRSQLNRAFVNLVRNAVQAIQNTGWVKVHLFQKNDRACITIEDNGVGIPYDVQPRIFEPSFSTKNSGMGLGLAITQRIVEAMKGEIRFESEPNKGTIFILEFPIYAV
jgi:signal transduction histidine kinase